MGQKMSKSLNNYVGVTDEPKDMFGKLMSIPDELMAKYYLLVLGETLDTGLHPMVAKKALGAKCVTLYHDAAAAEECLADWDLRFSKRDLASADLPVLTLPEQRDVIAVVAHAYAQVVGAPKSNGDIRRLIQGGSIQLNGEKVTDPKAAPEWKAGDVLKLDKKNSVRVG